LHHKFRCYLTSRYKIKQISSLPSEILNILHHASLVANIFTSSASESLYTHIFFLFLSLPPTIFCEVSYLDYFLLYLFSLQQVETLCLFLCISVQQLLVTKRLAQLQTRGKFRGAQFVRTNIVVVFVSYASGGLTVPIPRQAVSAG
jgi:hypothetical protein